MKKFILIVLSLVSLNLTAKPIDSYIGHLYWGLGPNFGLLGNVRLGFGPVEVGVLQNAGFGVVYVHRTESAIFYQLGIVSRTAGTGIIGGGGLEWDTSSFFRFRTDITVLTDSVFQTEGFVSVGGVFIL